MARKDVDLVIRAKDEAAKAVNAVTTAVNKLRDAQTDLTKSAGKTDTTLGALGAALGELERQFKGFTVTGKLSGEMDRAAKAAERLEAATAATAEENARLNAELAKSSQALADLTAKQNAAEKAAKESAAALKAQKATVGELNTAYRESIAERDRLQRADTRLTEQISKQEATVLKTKARYAELAIEIGKTAEPTNTLKTRFEAASKAVETQINKLDELKVKQTDVRGGFTVAEQAVSDFAAKLAQANAAVDAQKGALAGIRSEYVELRAAVRTATEQQRSLDAAAEGSADSLARQREALIKARSDLTELSASARKADAALSALGDGSTATLRQEFERQRAAMQKTREEWGRILEASLRLRDGIDKIGPPVREQAAAFFGLSTALQGVEKQYFLQDEALRKLGAILQETGGDVDALRDRQQRFLAIQSELTGKLNAVEQEAYQAATAYQKLATESSKVADTQRRVSRETSVPQAGQVNALADAYRRLYGETRTALSFTQRLRSEVLSLVSAFAGIYAVINVLGQVVKGFQTVEAATSRLNVVFDGSQSAVAAELDFVRRTADRLGIAFGELADQHTQFAIATKGTNLEGDKTRKIFVSVAEAARVNNLSMDQLKGVFTALTQIVSKGKVQMEELRQQLGDRLPGAIQIMADALGVSTDKLFEMTQAGEVSSDALVKFAEELDKRFGSQLAKRLEGTTAELGRFQNSVFQALAVFGNSGFIESFTGLLKSLNETLRSSDFEAFTRRLSQATAVLVDALAILVRNFDLVVAAAGAFVGVKIIPFVVALTASIRDLFFTIKGTSIMMQTAGSGLAAFGSTAVVTAGRVGILANVMKLLFSPTGVGLAVAAVSAGIALWATSADRATDALNAHQKIVDIVKNAYDQAGGAVEKWADKIKGTTLLQAQASLANLVVTAKEVREQMQFSSVGLGLGNLTDGSLQIAKDLRDLQRDFLVTGGSVDEYKKKIQELADQSKDPVIAEYAVGLLNAADAMRKTEDAAAAAAAVVRVFNKTATEADEILLGLKDKTEKNATAAGSFTDAMNELTDSTKKLSDEMKALAELDALGKAYENAVKLARTMGEVNAATDAYNRRAAEINAGANNAAVSGSLVDRIIGVESGGNASARNPLSTATGLGQFIESTWLRLFKEHFPDRAASMTNAAILALREDAKISRDMVSLYIKENAEILRKAGIAVTDANLYLAHFLGPGGAKALLSASAGTPVADILSPGQINANAGILRGRTAGDVAAWAQRRVGTSDEEVAISRQLAENEAKRTEKAKEYTTELEARLALQAVENANNGKLTEEAFVRKALAEEEKRAKEAGVTLSAQQVELIKKQAAEQFRITQGKREETAAQKEATDALSLATALAAQQATLEKEIASARALGDNGRVESLGSELEQVNVRLAEAIASARAMWETIGGPAADAAIAKLDALKVKSQEVARATFIDWKRVGELFASGLTNAIASFFDKVAAGEKVSDAAKEAFLQFASDFLRQIAQMILQQTILNALRRFFPSFFGGGGGVAGLGHTGGLVGENRIGSGNSTRRVDPALFATAPRFHGGGMPGLRPGEVAAILKKNEEVLTEDDPRNILNGGGSGGGRDRGQTSGGTKIINAIDSADMLSHALSTPAGEKVIMNFVRANRSAFQREINT